MVGEATQTLVRNRIFEEYKQTGYLTALMKRDLESVGIDPYKQSVEFSTQISQEGAIN